MIEEGFYWQLTTQRHRVPLQNIVIIIPLLLSLDRRLRLNHKVRTTRKFHFVKEHHRLEARVGSEMTKQERYLKQTGLRSRCSYRQMLCSCVDRARGFMVISLLLAVTVTSFVSIDSHKQIRMKRKWSLPSSVLANGGPAESSTSFAASTTSGKANKESATTATTATIGNWEEVHGNYLLRPKLDDGPRK
jgi:hypothetical protein